MAKTLHSSLFMSLISEINNYKGNDPLLPWLRGIHKLRESLPPQLLKEKLGRFLEKCVEKFESDRRYRNDLRYLRVWNELIDILDDNRSRGCVFKRMEKHGIGKKHALFYKAYALYFEKLKKFEEAEKMYHLGVQNLAEPIMDLQKSYEQFLRRMQCKIGRQEARAARISRTVRSPGRGHEESKDFFSIPNGTTGNDHEACNQTYVDNRTVIGESLVDSKESGKQTMVCNEDTVVVRFLGTVGKSEAEEGCHHGLVEPTINMKDAMYDINNMFREPLEVEPLRRRKSQRNQPRSEQRSGGFEVFLDESLDNEMGNNKENRNVPTKSGVRNASLPPLGNTHKNETRLPLQETFKIFVDGEDEGECSDGDPTEGSDPQVNFFVFPRPSDVSSSGTDDHPNMRLREDTVVGRFVGSAILDDPEVENACHHGLVDPTINLKEAMDDINGMFGKPIDFVRTRRPKRQGNFEHKKRDTGGFSILADDDLKTQPPPKMPTCSSSKVNSENDFFEPTVFTKQAMDDINEMFGKPLDF